MLWISASSFAASYSSTPLEDSFLQDGSSWTLVSSEICAWFPHSVRPPQVHAQMTPMTNKTRNFPIIFLTFLYSFFFFFSNSLLVFLPFSPLFLLFYSVFLSAIFILLQISLLFIVLYFLIFDLLLLSSSAFLSTSRRS